MQFSHSQTTNYKLPAVFNALVLIAAGIGTATGSSTVSVTSSIKLLLLVKFLCFFGFKKSPMFVASNQHLTVSADSVGCHLYLDIVNVLTMKP